MEIDSVGFRSFILIGKTFSFYTVDRKMFSYIIKIVRSGINKDPKKVGAARTLKGKQSKCPILK
jgi:hypothetical protein